MIKLMIDKKIDDYISLLRLKNPVGYFLLFLPCSFSVAIHYQGIKDLYFLLLYFLGAVIMRSAGCAINDSIDKNIDKMVDRTKERPIARGSITKFEGYVAFCILSLFGLLILLQLSSQAIVIGILCVPLIMFYPLMKRYTHFPQLILGAIFNSGVLIAAANSKQYVDFYDFVLYLGCVSWTVGYDTIYAFMDYKDDIKINVKSTAIFFLNRNYKFFILLFYFLFLAAVVLARFNNNYQIEINYQKQIFFISIILLIWGLFLKDVLTLDIDNRDNCIKRFKANAWYGALIFFALILSTNY
jgi:4-hydroxybenzoate polyprenyltransferase